MLEAYRNSKVYLTHHKLSLIYSLFGTIYWRITNNQPKKAVPFIQVKKMFANPTAFVERVSKY